MRSGCCYYGHATSQLALSIFAAVMLLSVAGEGLAQVTVRLQRDPVVGVRDVRLADIASITAASPKLVAMIGRLDVASIPEQETTTSVRTSFVRIRLLLAGWQDSDLIVEGPEQVLISYRETQPVTDADVERAARDTMTLMFGTTEDNIRVRLTDVFVASLPSHLQQQSGLRVEVSAPARAEPGPTSMRVRLWKDENLVAARMARFNVMKRQRVVVTKISLQRESTIGQDDVQFENRFLSDVADEPAESDIYGRSVRTAVGPGKILSLRDLEKPTQATREIVVKTRDNVQVTATGNGLRVRLTQAEAMQSGRVGDVIRLRNPTSRETITGRIVAAGEVEIDMSNSR